MMVSDFFIFGCMDAVFIKLYPWYSAREVYPIKKIYGGSHTGICRYENYGDKGGKHLHL